MGIKNLAGWLAIIASFATIGTAVQALAIFHNETRGFSNLPAFVDATLAFLYLLVFCGVAIIVLGCLVVVFDKRNLGFVIALLAVACIALVFNIVTVALMFSHFSPTGVFFLVDLFALPAIISLLAVWLYKELPKKNNVNERIEILKSLRDEGVLSEEEYKDKVKQLV